MSKLVQWLDHRREVVGFEKWKDLAEFCGLSLQSMHDAQAYQTLSVLDRSERRLLAAALRVSLRKLEQLSDGQIDWIEDSYVFDPEIAGRPLPRQEDDPLYWAPKETRTEDRGTPLLGRIKPSGEAEADEEWQEDWGRRLPARFGKGYDIYALELEGLGRALAFRNIPAWEFRDGTAAVYCWNGWEARGWFGQVRLGSPKASVVTPDGRRLELQPENVVRIGKIIGRWPTEASGV